MVGLENIPATRYTGTVSSCDIVVLNPKLNVVMKEDSRRHWTHTYPFMIDLVDLVSEATTLRGGAHTVERKQFHRLRFKC